jgi:hypothetical protein
LQHSRLIESARNWVETVVVGLQLCPFAKRELSNDRVRFAVTDAKTAEELVVALAEELRQLDENSSIETTLLIHHRALRDFYEYNDFLSIADGLLIDMNLEGVIQIASFHPEYQFADTEPDDVQNYTNRSPDPMLHLIREDSLEWAIAEYPDVGKIPERNILCMNTMGASKMRAILHKCSAEAIGTDSSGDA